MIAHQRVLVALCAALLVAGGAGAATHQRSAGHPSRTDRTAPAVAGPAGPAGITTTTGTVPATATTGLAPTSTPPPGSAALAAGLVTPADMGGYYRVIPSAAAELLGSAPCLGPLRGSPAPAGRAETALLGPDAYSMPMIVEEAASYAGSQPTSVYASAARALAGCPDLSFAFAGTPVRARLTASTIPPVGDADHVWAGTFSYAGAVFSLQLGLVLDSPLVLAVVWVDSSPPSAAVMGGFTSTVSLAIGKLA
jgi:hypothetical protein